jgi:60S ribosome subunit biogenesis protein NIP7
VNKDIANLSVSFPRDQLLSAGTMVGKFTKVRVALLSLLSVILICWQTGKFRINLTALDLLAQNARYKVRTTISALQQDIMLTLELWHRFGSKQME